MSEINSMQKILIGFVAMILGVAILAQIALTTNTKTGLTGDSDTISIIRVGVGNNVNGTYPFHLQYGAPWATPWRVDAGSSCYIQNLAITNSTGGALVKDTDYTVNFTNSVSSGVLTGDIKFINSTGLVAYDTSNTTTAVYSYCGDEYLTQSWTRSILNLIPGLFAIALLAVAVGIFYSVMKDNGLANE